ncbi:hypothetical protein CKM354_000540400 [Cercospora kikuchii]|uniref:Uncharacterized protein n=1 Tax=Cercospora kikuchii TaxID=84275 RepID=A0A9P3CFV9_9PEZI|nr:uncharacterized protein CKM354_000540400 [Cercospora kikuchii]GIZ42124.1 hypothetical protein CKM354_000540400 [Cercospora kikuchii]
MSHEDQIVFTERKSKQLPSFNAELEVSELPPPHPLFQQEWDDSLAKAMSVWNSLDFRAEDETPKPTCYAALMREPGFIFTCTLRAWEFSWMMGYQGPCVVENMIRFWQTIDDHVALSPGVRVEIGSNKIIYLCPILPPTVSCRACNKSPVAFRAEYVMQMGLHRLTVDKIDTFAQNWSLNGNKYLNRPIVSHLMGDAGCMHVLHYVIENWKINLDRKNCSSNGRCPGHRDIDECFFPLPRNRLRDDDTVFYQPEFKYNRIIETPYACPHQGCDALLCWPELYIHYVSSHISDEMLPKYDHPSHYLPCPGCPFGLATLMLMKGSK